MFLEGLLGLWRTRNPEGRALPLAPRLYFSRVRFLGNGKDGTFLMFTLLFLLLDNSIYYKCSWIRNGTLKCILQLRAEFSSSDVALPQP